jgi:hypothetical protein
MMLRQVTATRYVTPLREGGSLPAIVEADDDGLYVVKFRGAGQGPRVLIAELICGLLGRALGLPVPEIVLLELDAALGRNEPDGEVQDLVAASAGLNLALDYLPGSLGFDALQCRDVDAELAARIVWFDALTTNVDRTARNPNLLCWHRRLYLIDHGAALYMHHTWTDYAARAQSPFSAIRDHILLPAVSDAALLAADRALSAQLSTELLLQVLNLIPDEWLADAPFADAAAVRAAYFEYLTLRLSAPRAFLQEARDARNRL